MRFFFRHSVTLLGVIFLLILSSGCANDTKMFSEISNGFAKSINLLNKEPGITTTGFGSDQNKKLFKVGIGIDRSIMTEERLKQLFQSYLINVASYTSELDPQKLLLPYNLRIEEMIENRTGSAVTTVLLAEKPSGSTVISWKSISFNDFEEKAREKELTERMLKTLSNLGFSEEEILELSPEKIAEIFAPGTQLDGAGFDPDVNQTKELIKVGIDINMSIVLYNLGYTYNDMLALSANETDFIFPNTELLANLKQKGFSEQEVQSRIDEGKTYKEIIKEALYQGENTDTVSDVSLANGEKMPKHMPADFQFILMYGVGAKNVLDTSKETFTKDLVKAGTATTKLRLTPGERLTIYKQMRDIDILSYPEYIKPLKGLTVTSNVSYSLTISFGNIKKSIYWDSMSELNGQRSDELRNLINNINTLIESKKEYKKLPPAQGGYL